MKTSFFKEIRQTQSVLTSMVEDEMNSGANSPILDKSCSAIGRLSRYVASCKWCNTDKSRIAVRNIDRKASEVAAELGVSPHTVRSTRSNLSKKLYSIFGHDVFRDIIGGRNLDAIILRVEVFEGGYLNIENVLPLSIIDEIASYSPRTESMCYNAKDCESEIAFLRRYSLPNMKDNLETLSKSKLNFLYRLLLTSGENKPKMLLLEFILDERG